MMTCTICKSKKRKGIEAAIARGEPLRDIASRTGTSRSALDRHKKGCMGEALAKAVEDRETKSGLDVLQELENINIVARAVLGKAWESGDYRLALSACDRVLKQLEVQARFLEVLKVQEKTREKRPEFEITEEMCRRFNRVLAEYNETVGPDVEEEPYTLEGET